MNKDLRNQAKEFTQEHKRRSRWQKVVTCLAAVVVFCTTYALILPAITLERPTTCGKEEHTHTYDNNCYRQVTSIERKHLVCSADVLKHTQDCYDDAGNLICGYADFVVHTHDASCYENGQLVCPLPEIKAHTHDDSCYTVPETHVHGDGCYTQQRGELTCTIPEGEGAHTHTADCWQKTEELICEQEESEGHTHTESCHDADGNLICGLEESEGHTHTDECYGKELICGQEESAGHQHTDACFEMKQVLTCTESTDPAEPVLTCDQKEIKLHTHTSECYDEYNNLTCGKIEVREHVHTAECFQTEEVDVDTETLTCTNTDEDHEHTPLCYGTWELVCEKEEHTHTDECYAAEETTEATAATLPRRLMRAAANPGIMLLDTDGTDATSEGPADFTKYIQTVTYETPNYNPTLDRVETSFHMTFALKSSDLHPVGGTEQHNFYYELPAGLTIPDDMLGVTYLGKDTAQKVGFKYQFVKNDDNTYGIQIEFLHEYVQGRDNFEGYIDFNAYANEDETSHEYKYTFNDKAKVTIPIHEIKHPDGQSMNYDINVGKSNTGYKYDDNKITYTVTVDTSKGTPDPLNLTDVLKKNGINVQGVELDSVICSDKDEWGNERYENNQPVRTDVTGNCRFSYTNSDKSENVEISMQLPELTKGAGYGQKYTITYTVTLAEPVAGTQTTVGNKVKVTGTENNETVFDEAESNAGIDKTLDIQKSGWHDKNRNRIKWTITVNNHQNNIAGAELTDEMFRSADFIGDSLKFEPQDGIAWDENSKSLKISAIAGGVNKNKYTITYETYVPQSSASGNQSVTNTAVIDPPGDGKKETSATVTIDKSLKVVKDGTYDKDADLITWTIKINENGSNIAGAELTDDMFGQIPSGEGMFEVIPDEVGMNIQRDENDKIEKITFQPVDGEFNTKTYTITYKTPSGVKVDSTGNVTNHATFDPTPGNDGDEIKPEKDVYVDRKVPFQKSGKYDAANKKIWWRIEINVNGKNDIAYWVLKDSFLTSANDLSISIDYEGNTNAAANTYTLGYTDGKVSSITFKPIGDTGVNTRYYLIKYSTPAAPTWNGYNVRNVATLTPPGEEDIPREANVDVPAEGNVVKRAMSGTTPDENNRIQITWRTEVKIPSGGLPAGTVIKDELADDGQWMDWQQIQKWGSVLFGKQTGNGYAYDINYWWPVGETYTIKFTATDGTTCTYDDIVANTNGAQNKKFTKYELTFPNGVPANPYGGQTIYFDYYSYANVEKVENATFKNKISVKPPDSDAKIAEATHSFKKGYVKKTDGNGNAEDTTDKTKDGKLTWKVKVRTGGECSSVKVIDTLPAGVNLEKVQFNYNTWMEPAEDGTLSGSYYTDYAINGKYNSDGRIELEITRYPVEGQKQRKIPANAEFELVYYCRIDSTVLNGDDMKNGTSKPFKNTVTAWEDEKELGTDSQTQTITYDKEAVIVKVVDKTGGWDNANRQVNYSILLNPEGKNLGGDTLTLVDTMSHIVENRFESTLLPDTVKLYHAMWNPQSNEWEKGDPVENWSWTTNTYLKWNETWREHTITAIVPDETPMIFEYSYGLWIPDGSSFGVGQTYNGLSNSATLTGDQKYSDGTSGNVEWTENGSHGGISANHSYVINKVEKGNYGTPLPGAVFTVYDAEGNKVMHEVNGESVPLTYTTDSGGNIVITCHHDTEKYPNEYQFAYNTLYYLLETQAPEGYITPDLKNQTYYAFYFSDPQNTGNELDFNPETAVDLTTSAGNVYVENEKNATSITVDKKWFAPDGVTDITSTKGGSITFDLYRIESTTPPTPSTGESTGGGDGITVSAEVYSQNNNLWYSDTINNVAAGSTVELYFTNKFGGNSYGASGDWIQLTVNDKPVTVTKTADSAGTLGPAGQGAFYTYSFVVNESTSIGGKLDWTAGDLSDPRDSTRLFLTITPPATQNPGTNNPDGGASADLGGTLYGTYTIGPNTEYQGWTWSRTDLPKQGLVNNQTVYYTYYVKETSYSNCTTTYTNNGGIASGTITITNTESKNPTYVLPNTGGMGTTSLYAMGAALSLSAGLLLYSQKKRRKGGREDS